LIVLSKICQYFRKFKKPSTLKLWGYTIVPARIDGAAPADARFGYETQLAEKA